MIVRPRPTTFQLLYAVRGSVLPSILRDVVLVTSLSALVVLAHKMMPDRVPVFSSAPLTFIGIALSIFLAFRNSSCYDRWWEGRKLWGVFTAAMRQFARQTLVLEVDEEGRALRIRLIHLAIAFIHTVVPHLRPRAGQEASAMLSEQERAWVVQGQNPPKRVLLLLSQELAKAHRRGRISDIQFTMLDGTVDRFGLALSGCEQLGNTPVPFGYSLLLQRTAWLFCLFIPFGFADTLGWLTPVAVAIIAYCFFGLDAMGDQLERPFGTQPNALPIEALARIIEINMREALGETDLPPLPQPVDHVLM